jgi:stage II sporulation protein D
VKGGLIGIRVTRHGVSPRIVTAVVVGTRGQTTVTGSQLQHAFGLLATWATFTTISTVPGGAPVAAAQAGRLWHMSAQARAMVALVPLIDALVGAAPGLHGSVFPAAKRSSVAIQLRTRRGWRTVLHARIAAGGAFASALPGPGTYRVVYRGMSGPAVTVS